ncbi:MAG: hypothetical protein NT062_33835 [Proteobacteria bacterium]|nr:hypothetical protein [Pseudomonadota bacterium]
MIAATELATPATSAALAVIDQLLRDRDGMIARIRAGTQLVAIMRTMVATIALCGAMIGAGLGSYRGGVQIGYAAIKLPLVLLGTAALSAPALSAIGASLGRRARLGVDLAMVMASLAYGALLLAACTPLVLLARALSLPYHHTILAVVGMFAVAGIASLRMVVHALATEAAPGWRTAVVGLCVVFAVVGGQLAWALRPYLVRPRAQDLAFVRALEGSLFDAVMGTFASARGRYAPDVNANDEGWR